MKKKDPEVRTRAISEVAKDLRIAMSLTQQEMAAAMGWAISTTVRFEHGAQPSARMLAQMLETAHTKGLEGLAEEIQLHLNVALGPNFPITPDEKERRYVAAARRIFQNPKRHASFEKFVAREFALLEAEERLRKEHADELNASLDALSARKGAKK